MCELWTIFNFWGVYVLNTFRNRTLEAEGRTLPPGSHLSTAEYILVCPPLFYFTRQSSYTYVCPTRTLRPQKKKKKICLRQQITHLIINNIIIIIGCVMFKQSFFFFIDTFLHISMLGSFFWLNAMGYYIWRTFKSRNVFLRITDGRKYCYYSLYVWGCTLTMGGLALFAHLILDTGRDVNRNYLSNPPATTAVEGAIGKCKLIN